MNLHTLLTAYVVYFMFAHTKISLKRIDQKPVKQSVHIDSIGDVLFIIGGRAKYIRISLRPFGGVRVTTPYGVTLQQAMLFVEQKKDWILRTQKRMEIQENKRLLFIPGVTFSTYSRQLSLFPWKSEKFRVQLSKDSLTVFYPQEIDIASDKAQSIIRQYIIDTLRKEAKVYLPQRIDVLAKEHGFEYRGVTVKNVTSRWGSCSSRNHINLNIHLMRLPQELIDYVILHELVHTIHKNHSFKFWQCLDEHTNNNAKQLASRIKQYNTDF